MTNLRRTALVPMAVCAAGAALAASGAASAAAISPWLVFSAALQQGTHPDQLFRVHTDGSGLEQITSGARVATAPSFAPNGRQIAFTRLGVGVFVMNVDGSELHRLTHGKYDAFPVFAPNGKQIAFLRPKENELHVALMDADGTRQRVLPNTPAPAGRPSWTADGEAIVFPVRHEIAPLATALYKRVLTTGRVRKLRVRISTETSVAVPTLAPNGRSVVYVDTRPSPPGCQGVACEVFALYWAPLAGRVEHVADDAGPAGWSPDSRTLAYVSQGVLVVHPLTGGAARTIATDADVLAGDSPPAWQPMGA